MNTLDNIILAIDFWLYLTWIGVVVIYRKDWNGVLENKEEEKKQEN